MDTNFFRHFTHESSVVTTETINVIELRLPATLDASEFDHLNESILGILGSQNGGRWVIDLEHVEYIGSSVLGLIVNVRQRIKSGSGKLALCGMSGQLLQIFRHSSLERLFVIARSRDDAADMVCRP